VKFLGDCRVCGRLVPTYRSLGQHLRHATDPSHARLRKKWDTWRAEYRATLCCRKCGQLWEISDIGAKDSKRCPKCEKLRRSMSKRQYEKLTFNKLPDPRQVMSPSGSKAKWDGLSSRHLVWTPGDLIYRQVVAGVKGGEHLNALRVRLGISYKVLRAVAVHAFGAEVVRQLMRQRKVESARRMVKKAQTRSGLEDRFVADLQVAGVPVVSRNDWLTLEVAGVRTHREADIKVGLPKGRKLVVLCDGEVFHGPNTLYGDPQTRIADDVATAWAFFSLGYSVCRYSESEIGSGQALSHLQRVLPALQGDDRILRLWFPPTEEFH